MAPGMRKMKPVWVGTEAHQEAKRGYQAITRGRPCRHSSKESDRVIEAYETEAAKRDADRKIKAIDDYKTALEENWNPEADVPLLFEIGSSWIHECVTNHPDCHSGRDNYCPTRLLEVRADDGRDKLCLWTRDSSEIMPLAYLALSHCWGLASDEEKVLKTTTAANLSRRKEGIPIESLPQLYRDAIRLTRSLGESFLWVDSLCIIQDSEDDWAQESAEMGNIYANALCTISANAAAGSNETMFPKRELNESIKALDTAKYQAAYSPWGYLQLPSSSEATSHPAYHASYDLIAAGPTSSRGWCLQERQLSRRILHYTSQQVLWECAGLNASEIYPQGLPLMPGKTEVYQTQPVGPEYHRALSQQLSVSVNSTLQTMDRNITLLWYWFVVDFSKRKLTFPSDRLPAISGIAQDLSRRTKETYVAGLWKLDLLYGLSWMSSSAPGERLRIHDSAPSWSWASITGPIQFQEHFEIIEAITEPTIPILEIEDIVLTPLSPHNPTGRLRSGILKVRGYLSFGKLLTPLGDDFKKGSWWGGVTRTVEWDSWSLPHSKNKNRILVTYDLDVPKPKEGDLLLCLHLGAKGMYGSDMGLLLVPVEGMESTYTRIGVMWSDMLSFTRGEGKSKVSLCVV